MNPRTKRQKEVLDYITQFKDRHGHEPSYQQIARQLKVSSRSGVQRHIVALENQGLIARRREKGNFGIDICIREGLSDSACVVELLEYSPDSGPADAIVRSHITMSKWMIEPLMADDVFAFRIADDSLAGRNVCDGDVLFFEKRNYARRGEVVAAVAEKERWHVGLYSQQGSQTEIRPANPDYEPLVFQADKIAVRGVMRGLLRPFPAQI